MHDCFTSKSGPQLWDLKWLRQEACDTDDFFGSEIVDRDEMWSWRHEVRPFVIMSMTMCKTIEIGMKRLAEAACATAEFINAISRRWKELDYYMQTKDEAMGL